MQHKEIVRALIRLDILVNDIVPKGEREYTQIEEVIIGLFMTIRGLYKAIIHLLIKEMATECEILVRSLITASLRLMYLNKHLKDRDALICSWIDNMYIEWDNITKEA